MKTDNPRSFPKGGAQPAIRALASIGVHDLDTLARRTEPDLLALHGVGPNAIRILKQALGDQGMQLKGQP